MKLSFLFWNLHRSVSKTLMDSLGRMAASGIETFLFAEPPVDLSVIERALNGNESRQYRHIPSFSRRVTFFSALKRARWSDRFRSLVRDRITAQELELEGVPALLLVAAHLDPANHQSPAGRAEWARVLAADIRNMESDVGHQRTVLVGDLNMNPFESGLIDTSALHAVMTKELALDVQGFDARQGVLPFFNPMWSCFGEGLPHRDDSPPRGRRPPGTFFYPNTSDRANQFWNMYDQVLLRPAIMDTLRHLEILDSDGEESFVTKKGRPRTEALSDHLPILFELDL